MHREEHYDKTWETKPVITEHFHDSVKTYTRTDLPAKTDIDWAPIDLVFAGFIVHYLVKPMKTELTYNRT